jgi:NADH:ubiquinone oxidoreductase subunit 4 (subunit M)
MVSHGIILAILFYLVGIVEAKVGTRELDVLNGLMNPVRGLPMIERAIGARGAWPVLASRAGGLCD